MPHMRNDEELDFSPEPDPEEELDFEIDVGVDDEFADDTALERELGQSWRSGRHSRENE